MGTSVIRCHCGADAKKLLTCPQVVIPFHDRAVNHAASVDYDKWFYSDGCQEKLKSGEYRIASNADKAEFGQSVSKDPVHQDIPDHAIADALAYADAKVAGRIT